MMRVVCALFGHVPMLERRHLRMRCQRCGRVTAGITLERAYTYRYPVADGRYRLNPKVTAWLRAKARAERQR